MSNPDYDVVIVGSGVTGALMAWSLARAGMKVLMLEAGEGATETPRVKLVERYAVATKKTPSSPYAGGPGDELAPIPNVLSIRDGYYDQTDSPDPYKSTYERRAGGSTWHWLGNCPRLIPNDFRLKTQYGVGVDWPISYADLEDWYCQAEHAIGVAGDHEGLQGLHGAFRSKPFPMSEIWSAYGDSVIERGLRGQTIRGVPLVLYKTPQGRNSMPYDDRPPCAGNSSCVPICPIQAKYDATVHIKKAMDLGAEIRSQSVVTKLELVDGKVSEVKYRPWQKDGKGLGPEQSVTGKIVVVAANAIESAKLLLLSGVANSSDQVGRNLMDHLAGQAGAVLAEQVFPLRGPPTTSGIDGFRDGEFRRSEAAFRMSMGNNAWGRIESPYAVVHRMVRDEGKLGNALRRGVEDRITRLFRISYSTEMLPNPDNRVTLSDKKDATGIPRPKLHTQVDEYSYRAFKTCRDVMGQIFTLLGATEVRYRGDARSYSGAGHVIGTCRMGADAGTSVVDPECRSHDHKNLFVVGGATFPTGGTANPTLTIAALALRAAASVQQQLDEGVDVFTGSGSREAS